MAYPDLEKPLILHVDASEVGLGAVLYQHQDGVLRVIAFGSWTLTAAERNYKLHSGKLEFLALKCAVTEWFMTICSMHLILWYTVTIIP